MQCKIVNETFSKDIVCLFMFLNWLVMFSKSFSIFLLTTKLLYFREILRFFAKMHPNHLNSLARENLTQWLFRDSH